ncbi:MAG: serine/threonine protein kinase [Arthrospira sp. PLM2.Bin9]|nr:serine/threonine-protein kinase [Arthrospira sp. PLM2.Bin9]TVU55039.1 MAG: serine/threonine protein kinase [Arthrospira sp. PLM2.Bin9]
MINTALLSGQILRHHYLIIRELGHGGFGRTYLAKDQHRFDELCVLKEFAPQVKGNYELKKSRELFQREAQTLYQLKHSQIPRFQELFEETIGGQVYIFVVQDYVEGFTYRELLKQRLQKGEYFSQAEITEILLKLLPVLDYIHSLGVIHRDISPDNIIRRDSDGLPILIDFGGVKLIKARIKSQLFPQSLQPNPATRLGKFGYAPDEQMQMGIVYPHSDLYALAATLLVLLTGKEPQELMDSYNSTWKWQPYLTLNPQLDRIFNKMLARQPSDRYVSARQILQDLNQISKYPQPTPTQPPPESVTPNILAPQKNQPPVANFSPPTVKQFTQFQFSSSWKMASLVVLSMVIMGSFGWWAGNFWADRFSITETAQDEFGEMSELERIEILRDRRRHLGVNYQFFMALVNEEFYFRYPQQQGRLLTNDPVDFVWRKRWDQIAHEVLNELETLSDESRQGLGSYTQADLNSWISTANRLNLSTAELFNLADTQFYQLFPERRDQGSIEAEPLIQIWRGIVRDRLSNWESINRQS